MPWKWRAKNCSDIVSDLRFRVWAWPYVPLWCPRSSMSSVSAGFVSVYMMHSFFVSDRKFRPGDLTWSPPPQAPLDNLNQSKRWIVPLWHHYQHLFPGTSINSFFPFVCVCSVSICFEPSTDDFPFPRIRVFPNIPRRCFVPMFNHYMSWAWFIRFARIMHLTREYPSPISPFFLPFLLYFFAYFWQIFRKNLRISHFKVP